MKTITTFKNKTFLFSVATALCFITTGLLAQEVVVKDTTPPATPQDYAGRTSLSEIKETPLPGLSDSVIKAPSPMEPVVSSKEPPSEQLLGRISDEVFHEMADIERANVFLKIQTEREQLKNNLEDLKSKYRKTRLDEIEKRENVIKTRVQWQQEQEQVRQKIIEQQLQTELLEKKLDEAEMEKENLLPLDENAIEKSEAKKIDFSIQKIVSVKGIKGNLTASVIDNLGKSRLLRRGDKLPSGDIVKRITKTDIVLQKNGVERTLNIRELSQKVDETEDE